MCLKFGSQRVKTFRNASEELVHAGHVLFTVVVQEDLELVAQDIGVFGDEGCLASLHEGSHDLLEQVQRNTFFLFVKSALGLLHVVNDGVDREELC